MPDAGPAPTTPSCSNDDEPPLPDPRSPWQPAGVHGPSRLYDHAAFAWTDSAWTGRQLPGSVLYELHVGTFTPEGTFDAAIDRLDHLVDLGVDLVELLPVNAFNGEHNWGYDGVCWYAPHEPYGGPDGLKRFVDAAHAKGPGGDPRRRLQPFRALRGLRAACSGPTSPSRATPGAARSTWTARTPTRYAATSSTACSCGCATTTSTGCGWTPCTRCPTPAPSHLLEELAVEVESLSTHLGRPLSLIAESDLNDPRLITPREAGGFGLHAQWNDDAHHALHTLLTGERQGYYGDFGSLEMPVATC